MTWDLFGREKRDAMARNEARATMDALDKTVNGDDVQVVKWNIDVVCTSPCKSVRLTKDPMASRWICPGCNAVIEVKGLRQPDAPTTKGGK